MEAERHMAAVKERGIPDLGNRAELSERVAEIEAKQPRENRNIIVNGIVHRAGPNRAERRKQAHRHVYRNAEMVTGCGRILDQGRWAYTEIEVDCNAKGCY